MNFESEADFEIYICTLLSEVIKENKIKAKVLASKKVVDIVILRTSPEPACMFLELKFSKKSSGRIGIGQAKGRGFQPEILRTEFDYFENNLRWILAVEDKPDKYFFADNTNIRQNLSGGGIGEKYNNIKAKFFSTYGSLTEDKLKEKLTSWLRGG